MNLEVEEFNVKNIESHLESQLDQDISNLDEDFADTFTQTL